MCDAAVPPSRLAIWVRAIRAFSFTASLTPVLVAAMLALSYDGPVWWGLLPMIAAASVLFHTGTNLVSDAADFDRGVDREGTHGGSGVLVEGQLASPQVFRAGLLAFAVGSALGLTMAWLRGWPVLAIGGVGLVGGFLYGGRGFGYKYHALGDLMVFLLMGPLSVIGAFFVLTGDFHRDVFYFSLPVGCLVAAVLHSNNLRDIADDSAAGIRTMANVMGARWAKVEYLALVGGAYLITICLVLSGRAGPWCLLILLSLPPAIANARTVARADMDHTDEFADIDVRTAKLHLLFGVLLSVGLLLSALL
jgi:1,4-dihydroxy-2-naphthoate polyprenyltransferase